MSQILCPKCGSSQIHIVWTAIADPLTGIIPGIARQNKTTVICLDCGHKFKPKDSINIKGNINIQGNITITSSDASSSQNDVTVTNQNTYSINVRIAERHHLSVRQTK